MDHQFSLNNIDSLLFQYALQTRELSQKKNAINQQIKVCRAAIAERRAIIEKILNKNTKLDLEIRLKQNTVMHNKGNVKSTKATNSLLLQYEQTLKDELESRRASYNHDIEVFAERIASYRKIFQSHEEYHCQSPLAQNLLALQAEKEEIECRIRSCDDQITMKQKELDHLRGPAVNSSSTEKPPDSVSGQQPITELEKQLESQTEEDRDSSIDISSLHLSHTKNSHKTSVDANYGEIFAENSAEDIPPCCPSPGDASQEAWSRPQVEDETWPDVIHQQEQDHKTGPEDQEQPSTVSNVEEAEEEMETRVATEEEQAPSEEDNEEPAVFPQTSFHENNPQFALAKRTTVPSTPTFPFNFSLASSPHQGSSETKSPAFLFSLNPDPSTPGFSGFGFDVGSSQDEDSSFTFAGSFFDEKKTKASKSSDCPEFLFGQPEQSEDFQFAFSSKSPQISSEDNTKDDFPFSFNF